MKPQQFNLHTIDLHGRHLIEASAGTGKTYSLALLALRQLLEARLPVRQVLMVTFTRAAVAELEKRVRLFVKAAADAARGMDIQEAKEDVEAIVARAVDLHGAEETALLLRRAQASLDELSIYTIDSFCKRMLDDFAFETNQLFGASLSADAQPFLQKIFYQCWRELITQQPPPLFAAANLGEHFTLGWFGDLMSKAREGKLLLGLNEVEGESLEEQLANAAKQLLKPAALIQQDWLELENRFHQHAADIKLHIGKSRAGKEVKAACDSWENFAAAIKGKAKGAYITGHEQVNYLHDRLATHEAIPDRLAANYFWLLSCLAVQRYLPLLNQELQQRKTMLFSDLVEALLQVLQSSDKESSERLKASIGQCFSAVFIDEFQDTSERQFQLFYQLFGQDKALYFIGDPKQSIYAFRQADIFTYLQARSLCSLHVMNTNYRSSRRCVDALNQFFAPTEGFDAFGFGEAISGDAARIDYQRVQAGENKHLLELLMPGGQPAKALVLHKSNVVPEAIAHAANALQRLLTEENFLMKNEERERVRPAHIGVLVRGHRQGKAMKAALAARGIPAVLAQDAKVLSSQEAGWMAHLLEAMVSPSTPLIRRALLHSFTNYRSADLLRLNEVVLLERFQRYQVLLRQEQKGVYPAVAAFLADFDVVNVQLNGSPPNERCLTNLYQVAELLHKAARRRQLSAEEVISWLRKVQEQGGEDLNEANPLADEYTQRMESDEEAVRIMTIHASKGLEFPIVCCVGLDMIPYTPKNKMPQLVSWRRGAQGQQNAAYYVAEADLIAGTEDAALRQTQDAQENLRLLYVALTRTVFQCLVFRVENRQSGHSVLNRFLPLLQPDCVHIGHGADCLNTAHLEGIYQPTHQTAWASLILPPLPGPETIWRLYSYSSLKRKEPLPFVPAQGQPQEEYDAFVFRQLPRGKEHGVLFHSLMERIDFSNEDRWGRALETFPTTAWEGYLQLLHNLVHTALPLPQGRSMLLSTLPPQRRLNELQFHLPLHHADGAALQALSEPEGGWQLQPALTQARLQGMLEGVVDLFFEHQGRYYILDWKTDFLGDDVAAYSPESIGQAMAERNYHLQALLYTVALHRYLQQRLPGYAYEQHFGGHVYVFVRGVRQGRDSGVFSRQLLAALVAQAEWILCGKKQVVVAG